MLIALLLVVGGIAIGFCSRVMTAVGLSGLVVVLSVVVWIARGDASGIGGLVLLAHLSALQSGYLLGAYLRVRTDDP
ncbi:hypothetical protein ASF41_06065 [Methylobacterium sp. Leaf111]|uniref:hypothetical protein n=1 Tax=Methylobacterium sp. Leaf111 TaxID=1736257 RepID=UPI0007017C6F|nr:hypothetical protein [Methylobacterium sp. Leaf111]KQP67365.1 hypothetical protein ASF41_06065 [Methylobacterium sp. Leaf111]